MSDGGWCHSTSPGLWGVGAEGDGGQSPDSFFCGNSLAAAALRACFPEVRPGLFPPCIHLLSQGPKPGREAEGLKSH